MQLSPAGERALKVREGPQGRAALIGYADDNGTPTAGYGHTGEGVEVGATYTEEQCDAWFEQDSTWVAQTIVKNVKVPLTQGQYDALFSFTYNVGGANFEGSTLLKKLNKEDYASVPKELQRWTISGGVKDQGLVNRRNSESGQWVQGAFVKGSKMGIDVEVPLSPWTNAHMRLKAVGTAMATSGITGSALGDAGSKLQALATSWHVLAYVGVALTVVGVVWGVVKRDA